MNRLLTNQYVLHLPGNGKMCYNNLLEEARDIKFKVDSSITIISPMTPDYEEVSVLAYQLNSNNIKWVNPVTEKTMSMPNKIDFILNALNECDTEYALVLDGGDTCICKDLDTDFIGRYKTLGKSVIYNATSKRYPPVKVEPIGLFLQEGKKSFLNAGVCFGNVDSLIKVYDKARQLKGNLYNEYNSEQFIIRHTRVQMLDTIGVDSDSVLFRSAHYGELG